MSRIKPEKIILLGSSALKIGEAGEFDYSGSQAIKAFKEEGIKVILVNPNIATIQTSEHLADEVYFVPVTPSEVEKVIKKEKPSHIALSFGGQTALNCGLELENSGVLKEHRVEVLGTPVSVIEATEDRNIFKEKLDEINVSFAKSVAAHSVDEAKDAALEIGYPVMVRIAFALGGLGSGVCKTEAELLELSTKAFAHTGQILIEEYLKGWKEVEYEIVRDQFDNCFCVCNMENFDPMGIHTGESIVIAPSQTLSNHEYHKLRETGIDVVRHLGIVGECNIQYALDPKSDQYRVIEVNARLSRSSALASKATGYPLAFVAAKLILGYGLHEVKNSITQVTQACFEPALDYVVVKVPRWDLRKFQNVSFKLGSGMKSVGEVMGIGRSFEEALQKALRMLENGEEFLRPIDIEDGALQEELEFPTDMRIFMIGEALSRGMSPEKIHELTNIDLWFLYKLEHIVELKNLLVNMDVLDIEFVKKAKLRGFSDIQISRHSKFSSEEVRNFRWENEITPVVKQIDTTAGEFPAKTNFLYLTYHGEEDDIDFNDQKNILVLGGGAYRIGSSVEFDWCCVNSVMALRKKGYQTIMLNYNPETVSTDYDECDRLYFDEISLEVILDMYRKEKFQGCVVSMGGQIPNNLSLPLKNAGIPILGTDPVNIDRAEDRHKFSGLLDDLEVDQPDWKELVSLDDARGFAHKIGYPVLIRPSYVLSGAAMSIASNDQQLEEFLTKATDLSSEHPVVISKFILGAKEVEFDGIAGDGEVKIFAMSEHIEAAGVHSGDSSMVLPPQRVYPDVVRKIKMTASKIAKALEINGPFNMQFMVKDNVIKVIECNLRASRSFPFVSKIFGRNFIDVAISVMLRENVQKVDSSIFDLNFVGVKAPQFSFTRLGGADPKLGVEMTSTGEVACLGKNYSEALLQSLVSVGFKFPIKSVLLSTGSIETKAKFLVTAKLLEKMGIKIYGTRGTSRFLSENGIDSEALTWPDADDGPRTTDYIKEGKIDLVVNIPKNFNADELTNGYLIRRAAADFSVPLVTNIQLAMRIFESLSEVNLHELSPISWSEFKQI